MVILLFYYNFQVERSFRLLPIGKVYETLLKFEKNRDLKELLS